MYRNSFQSTLLVLKGELECSLIGGNALVLYNLPKFGKERLYIKLKMMLYDYRLESHDLRG